MEITTDNVIDYGCHDGGDLTLLEQLDAEADEINYVGVSLDECAPNRDGSITLMFELPD